MLMAKIAASIETTTAKKQYKVTNWSAYNQGLINRGSITLWYDEDAKDKWFHNGEATRGGQRIYSDFCIETVLKLRYTFNLALRQTEGFMKSLLLLLKVDLPVMNYSTLCRRQAGLSVDLGVNAPPQGERIHILIDSTGLKVFGEGEWKVRMHGYSKRRTWRKFHVGVDAKTGQITSCVLTDNAVADAAMVEPILDETEANGCVIDQLSGDGAYDKSKVWQACQHRGIKPTIPPRIDAVHEVDGDGFQVDNARNSILNDIDIGGLEVNRAGWKRASGYHQRSKVETTMFRTKCTLGRNLSSRAFENQVNEARIKATILNKYIQIAKPISIAV